VYAKKRSDKTISLKLANELIAASNNSGEANKKKQETHRIASANRKLVNYKNR
jgi:small subunit ribosomal protein S7